jgi:hypothetical protein
MSSAKGQLPLDLLDFILGLVRHAEATERGPRTDRFWTGVSRVYKPWRHLARKSFTTLFMSMVMNPGLSRSETLADSRNMIQFRREAILQEAPVIQAAERQLKQAVFVRILPEK